MLSLLEWDNKRRSVHSTGHVPLVVAAPQMEGFLLFLSGLRLWGVDWW